MSDGKHVLADWTTGAEAIVYQSCATCGSLQYFRRSFCVACGAPNPAEQRASGEATVYATSLVCRAATPETRAHVPYNIVLVDTVEGFRMMVATTIFPSATRSPRGLRCSPVVSFHSSQGPNHEPS